MDILIFVIALSILVLVHELGHFFSAKSVGIKVEEFGLGLPPRMLGKKIRGTIFSLNWLPLGGFCKLYGEEGNGKGTNAFNNKNPWQKMLVVLGGVLMNIALAIIIFAVVYSILGIPYETKKVKIIDVNKNSPAEMANLKVDDWVISVGGKEVNTANELIEAVAKDVGKKTKLFVEQNGVRKEIEVEVRQNPPDGEGKMGVAVSNMEMKKIPWYQFYKGIGYGFKEAYYWGKIISGGVFKMVADLFRGQVPKDVAGPVGMYEATTAIKKNQGMLAVIHFFGVVSVNLAVVNILPFPALDGGRIIFVLYELFTRKKAKPQLEALINNAGMIILLSMIFLITIGDVLRVIR